jgi:ferredoxin
MSFFIIPLLGHLLADPGRVEEVGWLHYRVHALYALIEPLMLRVADWMAGNRFFSGTRPGRALLWLMAWANPLLPHGVVIPTSAAIHLLRDVEKLSEGQAHIAVGTCVCQWAMGKPAEPAVKDITIWYGAEIYTRHHPDKYRFITADEAVALLREFHDQGLTPVAEFCMQDRRWMFVLCNCDSEICGPTRIYNLTGRTLYPGPYLAEQDDALCLGREKCGACVSRCHFHANRVDGDQVRLDPKKCLGCGLCVTTCRGKARRLVKRPGYNGRLLPLEYLMGMVAE